MKTEFLELIERIPKTRDGIFLCKCGNKKKIRISAVKSGVTKSCGCHRRKVAVENGKKVTTHGMTGHPLYLIWGNYKCKYGVCKEWESFEEFYEWAKDKWKKGLGLARKNIDEVCSPSNCYFDESKNVAVKSRKQTCMKKYGFETALKDEEVKKKIRATNLEKYGVEVAAKSDEVKENTRISNREKYGADYPQQTEQYLKRYRKKIIQENKINNITFKVGIQSILDSLNINYTSSKDSFIIKNLIIHNYNYSKYKSYYKNLMESCKLDGYTSLFFKEDEINNKPEIIRSIILNKLNLSKKIYARKCEIKELTKQEAKTFFSANHLMGPGAGYSLGLFQDGVLYCAIQIVNKKGFVDVSRFCTLREHSVLGGYSRLLKRIGEKYQKNIQTFVDKRYGNGQYLENFGFKKVSEHLSFCWTKDGCAVHRMRFPGSSGYDEGWTKLWDCGQAKYVLSKN